MIPYFAFNQILIGPVKIYTWGLLVGLGFSLAYFWFLYSGQKKGLKIENIVSLALVMFAGGVFGSRFFFLLQEPKAFLSDVSLLWSLTSGSMFLGGLLGAIFFAWVYIKWAKLDFWPTADLAVLPLCLGIGIGRIGCALINDHAGAATNLPWGILWYDGVVRHPVGIYESLVGFILLIVLFFLRNKFKTPGSFFSAFLASYSGVRFLLDFTRQPEGILADPHWWVLSASQWIATLIMISVVLFYARIKIWVS